MVAFKAVLVEKALAIRLVLTDCDGVLTDGSVYYSAEGEQMKRFFIRDGMGVERLRVLRGIETGIVTGEMSESVRRRAEKLKITELHLGCKEKLALVKALAKRLALRLDELAYIGDDVNDAEVLKVVGLSACPEDAESEVKGIVNMVCSKPGGRGAFRELAEFIILSQQASQTTERPQVSGKTLSAFQDEVVSMGVKS